MTLNIISLSDLLKSDSTEEEITLLLSSFECKSLSHGASDVEEFLHSKAIVFERFDIARTYIVMSTYKKVPFIAGYFSISNKPLIISKRNFSTISGGMQKKLMGVGHKTDMQNYEIKSYLIGQLGKNYNSISKKAKAASGNDILGLAYEKIKEANAIVGGRIVYIECENNIKIIKFYEENGFRLLEDYESPNNLRIMVKKIEHL
ncbi:GNAT family acetyltransferase [Listeria monocytogenes]|nr:GNAT family acetyltransferase [Listeria monocytogenes]